MVCLFLYIISDCYYIRNSNKIFNYFYCLIHYLRLSYESTFKDCSLSLIVFLMVLFPGLVANANILSVIANAGFLGIMTIFGVWILFWLIPHFFGFKIGWLEGGNKKGQVEQKDFAQKIDNQPGQYSATLGKQNLKCAKCGYELSNLTAAFCPSCGESLPQIISDEQIWQLATTNGRYREALNASYSACMCDIQNKSLHKNLFLMRRVDLLFKEREYQDDAVKRFVEKNKDNSNLKEALSHYKLALYTRTKRKWT